MPYLNRYRYYLERYMTKTVVRRRDVQHVAVDAT